MLKETIEAFRVIFAADEETLIRALGNARDETKVNSGEFVWTSKGWKNLKNALDHWEPKGYGA